MTSENGLSAPEESLIKNETEHPSYAHYRDVFDKACLEELEEMLSKSNGKAFFLVHPFFNEDSWYEGHLDDAIHGKVDDSKLTSFLQRLRKTLPMLIEKGIPVIILQESNVYVETFLEEEYLIKQQYEALSEYLSKISKEINLNSLFVMYTYHGGPAPLKSETEKDLEIIDLTKRRMNLLKKAGLKIGIVSGRLFKGDRDQDYRSAGDRDYGWGKTADKVHEGFTLKQYYDEKRAGKPGKHPLQVIRPDQCVGEFLRMLAMNGIHPGISSLTHPDMIRSSSWYQPIIDQDGQEGFRVKTYR